MDGGQPSRRRDAARSRRIDQLKTEPVTWPTHAGCKGGIQGAGTGVTGRCNSVRNSRTGCQGRSYQTGCHAKRHSAAGEQALVNTLVNSKPRGTHRPGTQVGTHGIGGYGAPKVAKRYPAAAVTKPQKDVTAKEAAHQDATERDKPACCFATTFADEVP